jgi:YVTN family beta-propeller protein
MKGASPMRRITLLLLITGSLLAPVAVASASSFPVTNTADSGVDSLRQAIINANFNPGKDSIPINVTGRIELQSALPGITGDLDIAGLGQSLLDVHRAAGAAEFSVFEIRSSAVEPTVSISGLTISGGKQAIGGGIFNTGTLSLTRVTVSGNEASLDGGGIFSNAPLSLHESLITGNVVKVSGGAAGAIVNGGGVFAFPGKTLIIDSTIADNRAEASASAGVVRAEGAGALLADGGAIEQSTIAGNLAKATGSTDTTAVGGGLIAKGTRLTGMTITGSTITANRAEAATVAGANLFGNATKVRDTIVSNPSGGSNCAIVGSAGGSEGFNIDDGASCAFNQPTDHSNTNPLLAPTLRFNGGPTPNLALSSGSPALDQGKAFGATVDQRGRARPSDLAAIANAPGGDGSDIGAFELPGPPPPALLYAAGDEFPLAKVATIKTQSNALLGEPFSLEPPSFAPIAIALTPNGKTAYTANIGDDDVSAIDTGTELPGSPIALRSATSSHAIAISPDGSRAYVANQLSDNVSVIDTATNAELPGSPIVVPKVGLITPTPKAIAISPDGKRLYVAEGSFDLLYVIDTQTNAVTSIDLEPAISGAVLGSSAIAISPDGKRAYLTSTAREEVIVIDTQTNAVVGQPIKAGIANPSAIAISPDGSRAYVANRNAGSAGTLAVIDTQTNAVIGSVPVGVDPSAVAISPDGSRLYVANPADHDVTAIDAKTDQPLPGSPIQLGASFIPNALTVGPDQGPVASFRIPATLRLGAPLGPDASASHDPDGSVSAFAWDFGDGAKASGPSPQHPYTALGTYNVTLNVADNEGCSTNQIFTGQTASCNGSAAAKASQAVKVVLPAVKVSCPRKAKPKRCRVKLQVVTKKRHGKAETKLAKAKLKAGKSKLISLRPRRAFIATIGRARRVLVKETVKIGRQQKTRVRRLVVR